MEKHEIRKEFFKLRIKGHSYNQCRKILFTQFGYEVASRTLQRWSERLNKSEWDLEDASKRPKTIRYKITSETENKIIELRNKTGFGEYKLITYFDLGHSSIYKILDKHNLTKSNPNQIGR